MSRYTSEQSNIEDTRLLVDDEQVIFEVKTNDGKDIYSMPATDYAEQLEYEVGEKQTRRR